jgi:inosine/xanthosine triphosphatase
MRVAVGSRNPVKVAAVETILEESGATVTPVSVDSGVAEQPTSVAETLAGARNRARRALASAGGDVGVGIEGGVARFDDVDGLFLIMWAAATDGDRLECGSGPSLRLPETVADRIDAGEELGPVMDDLLGTDGIAENEGAAGALTGGLTDRQRALEQAVACAVGPFEIDHYSGT